MKKELYLGLDVHKDCILRATAEEGRRGEGAVGHAQDERRELAGQAIGQLPIERLEQEGEERPDPLEGEIPHASDDGQGRGVNLPALERDEQEDNCADDQHAAFRPVRAAAP